VENLHLGDDSTGHVLVQAATNDLYLGEFRHGTILRYAIARPAPAAEGKKKTPSPTGMGFHS
jgi:hypothetical protein